MRDVLDPKRQYKKQGKFKIPEYSQVGTIIEGPTEFFSSRLSKHERSQTLVDQTMTTEAQSGRFKSRYMEAQLKKKSGKKDHYKNLMARRKESKRSRSKPQS
jgi:Fcf2 pre-rRNA processing